MSSPINSSPTYLMAGQSSLATNPIITNKFLSKQEREALIQYTKHFIRKAVQIIVQSRLGDKKPTKSRVYAYNSDWFNLSIKDIAQITAMTKSSLGNIESLFNVSSPFCIEISLRTPENQTMILETWCILFNDQLVDPTQKVCYSVYKKMSLVLRSLMCNTRCAPTYQLSRRQSSDTYVLLYRMYTGEPIMHHLGENYATAKVGTVGTPIGSIIVNLAYRTRLTMSPQNSANVNEPHGANGGIQIKDDHFNFENQNRDTSDQGSCSFNSHQQTNFLQDTYNRQQNSPDPAEHSGPFKRSSSNLTTFAQTANNRELKQNSHVQINKATTSKTQPIPMKSTSQPIKLNQVADTQRNAEHNDDGNSTDEYNSSSIASTPDTNMYYFKLKSAAFVPSASFNNNYYASSIGSGMGQDQDNLPFINLMSNEQNNMNPSTANKHTDQQNYSPKQNPHWGMTQSPPPPEHSMDYNFRHRALNDIHSEQQAIPSPCSLPNFKTLDNQMQQHHFLNNKKEMKSNMTSNHVSSLVQPDDFVFIESKKIAFGLSNAANDLSTFFRACENAPILESFQAEPSLSETLKDLDQQLLMYESKIGEFDELIRSLETS